jgi:hypothetical protein
MPTYGPFLENAIAQVLDHQLEERDPPETGATLERLLSGSSQRF